MTASLRDAAQMALDVCREMRRFGNAEAILRAGIAASALRAAMALPDETVAEGYKLVPLEPTEEMIQAGCLSQQSTPEYDNYEDWCNSHSGGIIERIKSYLRKDYRAMLAAAPQPAQVQQKPEDFDAWAKNPYTLVLQKSIAEDYVPRHDAPVERKPLTDEQISEHANQHFTPEYKARGLHAVSLSWYRQAWRDCERVNGIKGAA